MARRSGAPRGCTTRRILFHEKAPLTANRRQGGLDCLCGAVWIMNSVIQILEEGGWGDSLPSADNLPVC